MLRFLTTLGSIILTFAIVVIAALYIYMQFFLPDIDTLQDVHLQMPMKVYTADNKLIGVFGEQFRQPVEIKEVPKIMIEAVLATEDQRFYEHTGVDPIGLMRAAVELAATGKKKQGGSTITMQVARNFFLSRKKSYIRKFNEILLAIKIEQSLTKDQILALYLNKVFFGHRAYGLAAAARIYYGKTLKQLSLAEVAMLAGLPQAPSRNNPISRPEKAQKRRDFVLKRMYKEKYITKAQYEKATNSSISAYFHGPRLQFRAPYVAEMVRRTMEKEYGKRIYVAGLTVHTTVNSHLQTAANKALQDAIMGYSKRHSSYRRSTINFGKITLDKYDAVEKRLKKLPTLNGLYAGAVLKILRNGKAQVLLGSGMIVDMNRKGYRRSYGAFRVGSLVRIRKNDKGEWVTSALPKVQGALVALNPRNGAILAMDGGFDYKGSNYNRAVQSKRQIGSNVKPFIYSAALADGYTMASLVNDAPVYVRDGNRIWSPENASRRFYGPTPLRVALYRSRNIISVRLVMQMGLQYVREFLTHFGFKEDEIPNGLSIALGTLEVSPLELVRGYAVFANGGYLIKPFIINSIYNENGQLIYKADPVVVPNAAGYLSGPPAPRVISSEIAYILTDVMQDVIKKGTGRRALVLKRSDIGGKTGTTNDKFDAWFSGFNQHIVATAWVGFDRPRTLNEYGGQAALPMWIDFMRVALHNLPEDQMKQPAGVVRVQTNRTGANYELFRKENAPHSYYSRPRSNHRGGYSYSRQTEPLY